MPYTRRLKSGKYAATVRLPGGQRRTWTDRLRGRVEAWALALEADIRRGDWIDPRAGELTVGDWQRRCLGARRLELASRKRDESHWRCHVAPRWESTPIGTILRPDVTRWVVDMERAGVGAATIEGSVGVLRALLDMAVDARLVRVNAAAGVRVPRRPATVDRVLHPDEDEALLSACDRLFPDRPDARLAVELMLYCGLRFEEMGGLRREWVDLKQRILNIGPVLERDGTIRDYPKTPAGERPMPVDDDVWPHVRDRALATPPGTVLIARPRGGTLDYSGWYKRVWRVVLEGRPAYPGRRGHPARPAVPGAGLDDPQPTPHDLRHTYCTRLGEQGMVGHELMALTGHESLASVQRYLHAGEDRFERARNAVRRARGGA